MFVLLIVGTLSVSGLKSDIMLTTEVGCKLWNDGSEFITKMPSYLEGSYFFQRSMSYNSSVPEFRIAVCSPSVVYVALCSDNDGDLPSVLRKQDWLRKDKKVDYSDGKTYFVFKKDFPGTLDRIYKKTFSEEIVETLCATMTASTRLRICIFVKPAQPGSTIIST